jgi:hypothetical protein
MILQFYNPKIRETPEFALVLTVAEPPEVSLLTTMMVVLGACLKIELLATMEVVNEVTAVAMVDEHLGQRGIHIFLA